MVFATCQMMGMNFGFPDVCLTPIPPIGPVPIPYPNIAMTPTGIPTAPTILTMCCPSHNMLSIVPLSMGDNPGVAMGVASGMVMGPERKLLTSVKVFFMGPPADKMLSLNIHNSTNCPGSQIVPSQPKVLILA